MEKYDLSDENTEMQKKSRFRLGKLLSRIDEHFNKNVELIISGSPGLCKEDIDECREFIDNGFEEK